MSDPVNGNTAINFTIYENCEAVKSYASNEIGKGQAGFEIIACTSAFFSSLTTDIIENMSMLRKCCYRGF
jgi:hypothetical protein